MAHRTRLSPRMRTTIGRTNFDVHTNHMPAKTKRRVPGRHVIVSVTPEPRAKALGMQTRLPAPPPTRIRAAPNRPTAGVERFDVDAGAGPSSRASSRAWAAPAVKGVLGWPSAGEEAGPAKRKPRCRRPPRDSKPRGNHLTEPAVVVANLREHMKHAKFKDFLKLFKDADADGSGTLSLDEMAGVLRRSFYPGISDEQVKGVFNLMDLDRGGDINFQEMFSFLRNEMEEELISRDLPCYLEPEAARRAAVPEATKLANTQYAVQMLLERVEAADARTVFRQLDANGDGEITHREFRNGLKRMKLGLFDEHIPEIIDLLDKDGNGCVNFDEFASALEDEDGALASVLGKGQPAPLASAPPEADTKGNDRSLLSNPNVVQFLAALAKDRPDFVERVPDNFSRMSKVFRELDKDQHTFVPRERLAEYFAQGVKPLTGIPLREGDAHRLALLCDHNKDGYVQVADALATIQRLMLVARSGGDIATPTGPFASASSDPASHVGVDVSVDVGTLHEGGDAHARVPKLPLGTLLVTAGEPTKPALGYMSGGVAEALGSPRSPRVQTARTDRSRTGSIFSSAASGASSLSQSSGLPGSRSARVTDGRPAYKEILRQVKEGHVTRTTRFAHSPRPHDTRHLIVPPHGTSARGAEGARAFTATSAAMSTRVAENHTRATKQQQAMRSPRVLADLRKGTQNSTASGASAHLESPFAYNPILGR